MKRKPAKSAVPPFVLRNRRLVVACLLAFSAFLRIACFAELNRTPLVWQHRWEASDMYFFDLWARAMAAGDWLAREIPHPYPEWQRQTAEAYFAIHPEEAVALAAPAVPGGPPADPGHALWNRWYGGKRYHQEPLYPYLIAFTYKLLSPDVRWVFAWQLLLGLLCDFLIYLIARRHFGDSAGLLALLLAVLCGPLLYYDVLLLRTSLATLAAVALVYAGDLALDRRALWWWLLLGVVTGTALLLNTPSAFPGFGILAWAAYVQRKSMRVFLPRAAVMLGGVVLCMAPVLARNAIVGAPPGSTNSSATMAFIDGNAVDARSEASFTLSSYLPAIMAATQGRFFPAVIETLKTHEGVWSYLRMMWAKFAATWRWYEKPNNANFYQYQVYLPVLRYMPVTFFLLGPLSIAGLVIAARTWREHASLYILLLVNLAVLVIFLTLSRLRLPMVAGLIPFAAMTLVRMAQWMREGRTREVAMLIVGVIAVSIWTMQPLPEGATEIRTDDYMVPYVTTWDAAEQQAQARGDWKGAAEIMRQSFRYEPKELDRVRPGNPYSVDPRLLRYYGRIYQRYADDLARTRDLAGAAQAARRSSELAQAGGRR